jgi:hypothetical protein
MIPSTIEKNVPRATIGIVFLIEGQSSLVTACSERSDFPRFPWAKSAR